MKTCTFKLISLNASVSFSVQMLFLGLLLEVLLGFPVVAFATTGKPSSCSPARSPPVSENLKQTKLNEGKYAE